MLVAIVVLYTHSWNYTVIIDSRNDWWCCKHAFLYFMRLCAFLTWPNSFGPAIFLLKKKFIDVRFKMFICWQDVYMLISFICFRRWTWRASSVIFSARIMRIKNHALESEYVNAENDYSVLITSKYNSFHRDKPSPRNHPSQSHFRESFETQFYIFCLFENLSLCLWWDRPIPIPMLWRKIIFMPQTFLEIMFCVYRVESTSRCSTSAKNYRG